MTVSRVLVVGGGITGSVLSVALAQRGIEVDLVEQSPVWTGIGHGITVQGNALLSLRKIGVLDEVLAQGVPFDNMRLRNADGSLIVELSTPHTGGPDLPSTMGSLRSALQAILCKAVYDSGTTVLLGTTVRAFEDHGDAISVVLADGRTRSYDLVVGCDGIRSKVRKMIGIETTPHQSAWASGARSGPAGRDGLLRAVLRRPEYKAGYTPISDDLCYAYLLDENLDRSMLGERRPDGCCVSAPQGTAAPGAGSATAWPTTRSSTTSGSSPSAPRSLVPRPCRSSSATPPTPARR